MITITRELLGNTVRRLARTSPGTRAMVFGDGARPGETGETLTYGRLDERARAVAVELRRRCSPGDRAVILCAHDAGYPVAFLACLYAGVVAVPLYAPELIRSRERLSSVIGDCAPAAFLTGARAAGYVTRALERAWALEPGGARLIDVDRIPVAAASDWHEPDLSGGSLAYLQYTSGSTGTPAGVRVTHANLAVTAQQVRAHFPGCRVTASWAPFFHDMGLIYGIAWPLSSGVLSVQLSPTAFIREPYRWLRLMSDHRAECGVTPNFALLHCVRGVTPERKRTLDLSSLRSLHIAGEPVRPDSVRAFAEAFAECGLAPTALAPSYGLAEATLAATAPDLGAPVAERGFDREALTAGQVRPVADGDESATVRLVGCGAPFPGVSVRIADPSDARRPLPAGRVGEICLSGPNIADGYWNQPRRSAEVFTGDGLRTGDLGFEFDGHLYIVGRTKDVIIVRGRNHHPADIEATAGRSGYPAVAFSVNDPDGSDGERLVILLETGRGTPEAPDATADKVRGNVARHHGLVVHDLLFVRRGSLPRTTSGKIRRGGCRERYLQGRLAIALMEPGREPSSRAEEKKM